MVRLDHPHEPLRVIRLMSRLGDVIELAAIAWSEAGNSAEAGQTDERFLGLYRRRLDLIDGQLAALQGAESREDRLAVRALRYLRGLSAGRVESYRLDRQARDAARAAQPSPGTRGPCESAPRRPGAPQGGERLGGRSLKYARDRHDRRPWGPKTRKILSVCLEHRHSEFGEQGGPLSVTRTVRCAIATVKE